MAAAADGQPAGAGHPSLTSCGTIDHMYHLPKYEGPNPFGQRIVPRWWQRLQIAFFTVTLIAPLRLLLLVLVLLLMALFGKLALLGADSTKPLGRCRRLLALPMRLLTRLGLLILGFVWVEVKGKRDPGTRVLVANHVGALDAAWLYYRYGAVEAAKAALFSLPIFGSVLRGMQCVPILRESSEGRQKALEQIRERCTNPEWPPFLIFPQGTTTREDTLTTFKRGAFEAGAKVQPICIRYHRNCCYSHELLDPMWWTIYQTACQFVNFQSVTFLEPYDPSEEERAQPAVFAERVRVAMAERLQAQLTPHSFDDVRLKWALKKRIGREQSFVMGDVFQSFSVPTSRLIALIDVYEAFVKNDRGVLSFEEFCEAVQLPKQSPIARRLFRLFDGRQNGFVDFEGFVSAVHVVTTRGFERDMLKVLFALVQPDDGTAQADAAGFERMAHFLEGSGSAVAAALARQLGAQLPEPVGFEDFAAKLDVGEARALLVDVMRTRVKGLDGLVQA